MKGEHRSRPCVVRKDFTENRTLKEPHSARNIEAVLVELFLVPVAKIAKDVLDADHWSGS